MTMTIERGERRLLPASEAIRELGLGRSQGYELLSRGAIPSVRLGARLYVPERALDALVGPAIEKAARTGGQAPTA